MSDITTTAAVKLQLKLTATGDDTLIDQLVTDASAAIETHCSRQFTNTAGTLNFDATGPHIRGNTLYFDRDVLSITSLVNGADGTLDASAYRLLPMNTSPKWAVELLPSGGKVWRVGASGYAENAIQVVGSLGYCTAAARPADVTKAATALAVHLYNTRDNSGETIRMADGTMVIPSDAPAIVFRLLSRYVRVEFAG